MGQSGSNWIYREDFGKHQQPIQSQEVIVKYKIVMNCNNIIMLIAYLLNLNRSNKQENTEDIVTNDDSFHEN